MPRVTPTERTQPEVQTLLNTLSPGVRYLLLSKFQVSEEWAAELAAENFTSEEMWRQMGSTREEVLRTLEIVMEVADDTKEGRKLCVQFLAVQKQCQEKAASDAAREAEAAAQGTVIRMDSTMWGEHFDKLKEEYPGLLLTRDDRPLEQQMGLLEGMNRTNDWCAEDLTQVVTKKEHKAIRQNLVPGGNNMTVNIALTAEIGVPKQVEVLQRRYTAMGQAWVSFGLKHPETVFLRKLRLESYAAFSAYVTGSVVGIAGRPEQYLWKALLDTELAVRREWFDMVRELNITLDQAILRSIGAVTGFPRSDKWQALENLVVRHEIRSKGGGKGKGSGGDAIKRKPEQGWQWGTDKGAGKQGAKGKQSKTGTRAAGKRSALGLPAAFAGKLTKCFAHGQGICYDLHTGGCSRGAGCSFCHLCCPQPGCKTPVSSSHGLWSH